MVSDRSSRYWFLAPSVVDFLDVQKLSIYEYVCFIVD